jgi:MATE family multidrug resistance protein
MNGPAGIREVLTLAMPLVASSLSWTVMNFVDRVFLMGHSETAVAAALPAGALFFTLTCLPLGTASYVTAFVSQYHGAGREHRIGAAVWQGIWLSLLASPLILATIPWAQQWFVIAGHSPEIAELETTYYQICCVSAPALIAAGSISGFFTGRGHSSMVMMIDAGAAIVNVVLDYCWIFGYGGFPAWGIAGAAWATVVALWLKAIVYFLFFVLPQHEHDYHIRAGMHWDRALMHRLIRFGGPSGGQMFIEVAAFTVFLMLIGRLGEHELAVSSLAFNLNNLAFMPAWGVSMATTTLVGQYLGKDRPDLATRSTWSALSITTFYMTAISVVYIFAPDLLASLHWWAGGVSQDDAIRQTLPTLMLFVASYCLLDGMSIIFAGALKGAGDTRFIMLAHLVLGAAVVIGTWVGIERFGLGLYGSWGVLTAWVFGLGLTFWLRFLQGHWRSMRVIEELPAIVD